jgi:hypothetical protein
MMPKHRRGHTPSVSFDGFRHLPSHCSKFLEEVSYKGGQILKLRICYSSRKIEFTTGRSQTNHPFCSERRRSEKLSVFAPANRGW